MTRLLFFSLVLLALTACASTEMGGSASSATPTVQAQQCENTGGQWRSGMCERAQGGGGY
jgi:hypothetical protein